MFSPRSRLCIAGGAAAAAALSVCAALTAPLVPSFASAAAPAPLADTSSQEDAVYLLRDWEGELCVFSGLRLVQRTGIPVSALPAADRALLQEGIRAEGRQALYALLEDLAS